MSGDSTMTAERTSIVYDGDGTCSVHVAGRGGSLEIKVQAGYKVSDVLGEALERLGAAREMANQLAVVVNAEDADLTTPVRGGDRVTAAPLVDNG